MEVINGKINRRFLDGGIACALGFFDGIHIGHQNLLTKLKEVSAQYKLKTMVFTFEKHPMSIINNEFTPKLIMNNTAKAEVFNAMGIDILNYNKVDAQFISMEPEYFLKDILIDKFNVKAIVVGFNFKFGYKGRGDSSLLCSFAKDNDLKIDIVEPVCIDGIVVSSTNIREFLRSGNINMANKFLGRFYSMSGIVVHGRRRGHGLGFPTANINLTNDLIIPKNGVYVTRVTVDETYKIGITNVGYNPTFGNSSISIETHILDYHKDIYGENIMIEYLDRLRDEIKFNSLQELSQQINKDMLYASRYKVKSL